ncbi:MAG: hypothetical protein A2V73_04415 [candidate division Zixibacteria bacterium RBG_19FT_COMBO_42_43]|nr:MAG: hypothetical protein A2V73_04415 [candidate division Zixibacteria bacterium RBG_19FT_COMBO_42_43]
MKGKKKGFTFVEIMLLVVIIVILPVLALSDSKKSDIKNKQSEAKMILKQIYTMQKAYKAETGIYWIAPWAASASSPNAFADIRIEIIPTARYSYTISSSDAGANNFTATATSGVLDEDAQLDTWAIDQTGVLRVTSDDAVN